MDSKRSQKIAVAACRADLVPPGQKVLVQLHGRMIGIFNVGGNFYALANRCPHQGAPVCLGRIRPQISADRPAEVCFGSEGAILRCPWHQWEFEIKTGRAVVDPKLRIVTYETEEIDGVITVYLPAPDQVQSKTTRSSPSVDLSRFW